MTEVTLHRAGRVLEAIRAAVGAIDLTATAKISIFGDPASELARKTAALEGEFAKLDRLLEVQARIRGVVGRSNVERGIADLLAKKAAAEEWIKLVSPLVTKPSGRPSALEVYSRRAGAAAEPTEATQLSATAAALRKRFEASDADVGASLETKLLDEAAINALKKRIGERRREIELLSARLRTANEGSVEIDDADIKYLTSIDVI